MILRLPELIEYVGLSRASIYNKIRKDDFPKQIKLGERASGWLQTDVDDWIAQRPRGYRDEKA